MKRFSVVFAITVMVFGVALAELSGFPLIAEVASFLRAPAAVMPRVVSPNHYLSRNRLVRAADSSWPRRTKQDQQGSTS